jgi:peptide-methionine (R)-S-oxide reductase
MTGTKLDRRALFGFAGAAGASLLLFGRSSSAASMSFAVSRPPAQWRQLLGPQRFHILREAGTERAFTSPLLGEHRKGMFVCAGCALPLFSSATKFESGTGWPSFNDPVPGSVETTEDRTYGMLRTEVHCSRCGSHLGHVFPDGPPPTGLRYCINGVATTFQPE